MSNDLNEFVATDITKIFIATSETLKSITQDLLAFEKEDPLDTQTIEHYERYIIGLIDAKNIIKDLLLNDIEIILKEATISIFDTHEGGYVLLTDRPLKKNEISILNEYFGAVATKSIKGMVNNIVGFVTKWNYENDLKVVKWETHE